MMKKFILFLILIIFINPVFSIDIDTQSILKYMEKDGEIRYRAIWIAYESKKYFLLPYISKYLLVQQNTSEQELILKIYNLLGDSLPTYLPNWYYYIDVYLNIKRSIEGIELCLKLAKTLKDRRLVYSISRLLKHTSSHIRRDTSNVLKELSTEYQLLSIIELLKSNYEIYNIYGLENIKSNPDMRLVPFIRTLSLSSNKMIKRYALRALAEYPNEALYIVSNYHTDTDEEVKETILTLIAEKNWRDQVHIVIQGMTHPNDNVRLRAVRSAKELGFSNLGYYISKLLLDEKNKNIILEGINALVALKNDPHQSLLYLLRQSNDFEIKMSCLKAIQSLNLHNYIEHLVNVFSNESDGQIQSELIHTIALLINSKNFSFVIPLLHSYKVNREYKLYLLSSMKANIRVEDYNQIISQEEIRSTFGNAINMISE